MPIFPAPGSNQTPPGLNTIGAVLELAPTIILVTNVDVPSAYKLPEVADAITLVVATVRSLVTSNVVPTVIPAVTITEAGVEAKLPLIARDPAVVTSNVPPDLIVIPSLVGTHNICFVRVIFSTYLRPCAV
jgi:hypothetical protein